MPLTDAERAELQALEASLPAPQGGGLSASEQAELSALEASVAPRAPQDEGGGILDFLGDVAGSAGEFIAKPALDVRDIIQQGVTPTEQFPFFELPESVGERAASTSETGRTLAALAAPAAGGAAGVALAGARGVAGRALGAGVGSGIGDVAGQAGEDIAQGQVPEIDEEQALLSAALGGVGQPIGELLTAAPRAVGRQLGRTFGGPGTSGAGARGGRSKFQRQVDALDDAGVPLTPGQRSGNTAEIASETTAAPTLLGGNLQQTLDDQGAVVRSKLMEKAGFDADDISEGIIDIDTIKRAKDRFSERYTAAFEGVEVNLKDDAFRTAIDGVKERNLDLLPFEQRDQLTRVIDDFSEKVAKNPITGERYQQIRSRLGRLERAMQVRDPGLADMYGDLKGALDDAFATGAGPSTSSVKKQIDREYRNFKVLERASQSAGADVAGGEPTIRNIANRARNATKGGTEDFRRLADAAQDIVTDRLPSSGTAQRLLGLTAGATGQATSAGIRAGRALGLGSFGQGAPAGPSVVGARAGAAPSIYDALTTTATGTAEADLDEERRRADLLNSILEAEASLQ